MQAHFLYKGLVAEGKQKHAADPFIIAQAKVHGHIVVTEEGSARQRRFPASANALGVTSINPMQLIDREDWVLWPAVASTRRKGWLSRP